MKSIKLASKPEILKGKIELPSSKSISNRVLLIKAMCEEAFKIQNLSEAGDTQLMKQILEENGSTINSGNTGTIMRFLTAYYAVLEGKRDLIGSERMKERPIKSLVDTLIELGAEIEYLGKEGYPPIRIIGKKIKGGHCEIDATVSSQFVSALLMVSPTFEEGIELVLKGEAVSYPYIIMTIRILEHYGIRVRKWKNKITIKPQKFKPKPIKVEPDWTTASYIYALASLYHKVDIELPGLLKNSIQGDSILRELMRGFGVKTVFKKGSAFLTRIPMKKKKMIFDFKDNPDLVPTFAILCSIHKIPFHFTGLQALKIKESNRIEALANELTNIGIMVNFTDMEMSADSFDNLSFESKRIKAYGDHRMAMSFALAANKIENLIIEDPDVVEKSYPSFWADLESLGVVFRYLSN